MSRIELDDPIGIGGIAEAAFRTECAISKLMQYVDQIKWFNTIRTINLRCLRIFVQLVFAASRVHLVIRSMRL